MTLSYLSPSTMRMRIFLLLHMQGDMANIAEWQTAMLSQASFPLLLPRSCSHFSLTLYMPAALANSAVDLSCPLASESILEYIYIYY